MSISINGLTKKYSDVIAINNVSLEINSGELFALLGVNGAGKTTLIKMLSGLTCATSGDAIVYGYSINSELNRVKEISNISPQETAVAESLTVRENIKFIAEIYRTEKSILNSKVDEIIFRLGLTEYANKKSKYLSGGLKRRLSIAMALISEPKVLYLDEPTLGLDVLARKELWNIILQLKGKVTIILTTHYLEEAEELADRIAIMNRGELIGVDTPKNFVIKTGEKNFEDAFVKLVSGEI